MQPPLVQRVLPTWACFLVPAERTSRVSCALVPHCGAWGCRMHHFPAGRARELRQVHRQLAQGNNSSTNTALPRGRGKALTFSCWRSGAGVGGWVGRVGHPAADPLGAAHLPQLFRHPRSSLPAPSSKHTRQYHFHKGLCSLQPALETAPVPMGGCVLCFPMYRWGNCSSEIL